MYMYTHICIVFVCVYIDSIFPNYWYDITLLCYQYDVYLLRRYLVPRIRPVIDLWSSFPTEGFETQLFFSFLFLLLTLA